MIIIIKLKTLKLNEEEKVELLKLQELGRK
jgi:hypothetical protein